MRLWSNASEPKKSALVVKLNKRIEELEGDLQRTQDDLHEAQDQLSSPTATDNIIGELRAQGHSGHWVWCDVCQQGCIIVELDW